MARRQGLNVVSHGVWDPSVVPYGGRVPGPLPRHPHAPIVGARSYRHTARRLTGPNCHTRFSEENRMHLICLSGSQFHIYDRQMSVISHDIAQNIQKRFINSIALTGVDTKVFTRTTITMTMRLHLHLPHASDWWIACLRTPRSH
jgi:hypothetical protein